MIVKKVNVKSDLLSHLFFPEIQAGGGSFVLEIQGSLEFQEIQMRGGVKKTTLSVSGGVDFFWNNPLNKTNGFHVAVHLFT